MLFTIKTLVLFYFPVSVFIPHNGSLEYPSVIQRFYYCRTLHYAWLWFMNRTGDYAKIKVWV